MRKRKFYVTVQSRVEAIRRVRLVIFFFFCLLYRVISDLLYLKINKNKNNNNNNNIHSGFFLLSVGTSKPP